MSGPTSTAGFAAAPYEYREALAIADQLELAEPVAIALVRRGHRTVEAAREFLAAAERHDPASFAAIDDAVAILRGAIERGERITVHGDYDVDGISATAILVRSLRSAGADCDWLIPDRVEDGYGLGPRTVGRLAERGTRVLVTADCGIGSVEEIAAATGAGIEAIVTDHHQPTERLPDCPIVHPMLGGYPFPSLCGAAVAHKLAEAVERALGDPGAGERDLDLVALATIADMVPLIGENRALARRGLAELRRARRPGLRALMAAASVEPERLDEGDIAFRLAPRINAAGRLYRADAGVELLLTDDPDRAAAIARELDAANNERREAERAVVAAAETAIRELPAELRDAPALVLAGEGWHPGVVGIAASRIAERHRCPAVLIALGPDGRGRGSGRSVPGFDLLAGLDACASELLRHGGHRAAAGLEIEAERVDAFRRAFVEHARAVVPAAGLAEPEPVDAIVGADGLGIEVAEQLDRLAPFGIGNPGVRLLVPWARVGDVRRMGEGERHARFSLLAGGRSARAVAFGVNGELDAASRAPHDLTVRLEVNHWNGAVEPRAVLGSAYELLGGDPGGSPCACPAAGEPDPGWWPRFERAFERPPEEAGEDEEQVRSGAVERRRLDCRGGSAVARIAELVSSGAAVLALCADAGRRAELALLAADPGRFGALRAIVCNRCSGEELERAAELVGAHPGGGLLLSDWGTFGRDRSVAGRFEHVVVVDPPPFAGLQRAASVAAAPGYLHEAWGEAELELAIQVHDSEWAPRAALAEIYRAAATETLCGEAVEAALRGSGRFPRSPELAARCLRVLDELEVVRLASEAGERSLGVVSSVGTALERSSSWRAITRRHEEGRRFLESRKAER